MAKKSKHLPNTLFVLLIIIIVSSIFIYTNLLDKMPIASKNVELVKCVDGDTARFSIDGSEQVVRFLAVDTPETVKAGTPVQPYGKEASDYTCIMLSDASVIKLEYEDGSSKDKYDRTLAWVWIDGVLLQQSLVSKGLAEVKYLYGDYKYTAQLQGVQKHAKEQRIGIWSE